MSEPEKDNHTGRMTTGHEWNGITELNTPVPKVVWFFLVSTILYAIVSWFVLPTWPTGNSYTKGVWQYDQRKAVIEAIEDVENSRSAWQSDIALATFEEVEANPVLMEKVDRYGGRLFEDNCAMCHGRDAKGASGFPNLTDASWLWGGDYESIMETLRVGINSSHEESHISEMMAFGRDQLLDRDQVKILAAYIMSLSTSIEPSPAESDTLAEGQVLFEENCSSCHGENGEGLTYVGAPNLTDSFWIYGGEPDDIRQTLYNGRQGVMPAWENRLDEIDRKILALYIKNLNDGAER